MYTFGGGSGLKGPLATGGAGAATGSGLAFTGFPVLGFTILAVLLIIVGFIVLRLAMVRNSAKNQGSA